MVVRDVGADILGVVEAEDRTTLQRFSDRLLADVGGTPYEQVMLVDGNDDRGIDVGVLVRAPLAIAHIRTHVFDRDDDGRRVLAATAASTTSARPTAARSPCSSTTSSRRATASPATASAPAAAAARQPASPRSTAACAPRASTGWRSSATSTTPSTAPPLAPLLADTDLRDISEHPDFDFGPRRGTFEGGNESQQVRRRPAVTGAVRAGDRRRRVPPRRLARPAHHDPWEMYATLTAEVHQASDHAAIYADVDL